MTFAPNRDARALAARLRARFEEAGATPVEPAILQSAEVLLDLYGEEMRDRAYVTADPARGEMMLRPDFTLPVVEAHMAIGAAPARYTYSGEVFRRQEAHPERASEYLQVGYEIFDQDSPAEADAEVFAKIANLVSPWDLRAVTGDIGILVAAVHGTLMSDQRRAALLRHMWRPRRFRALLDRFSGKLPVPEKRAALLAMDNPMQGATPFIGLRSPSEIEARIEALRADAQEPPLSDEQVALIEAVLSVRETCPNALERLRDLAVDLPGIEMAVHRLGQRIEALARHGVDTDELEFEGSYGRSSMEYYDGFVFGFVSTKRADLPPVATGGRYDALTARVGDGGPVPAVGGVIRPDLLVTLEAAR